MLRDRIITAVILLALFLAALFMLPDLGWAILITIVVLQGTVEWSHLASLPDKAARIYWWVTLLIMSLLIWFDSIAARELQVIPHITIYTASLLLWAVVPIWMIGGWKVRLPAAMMLVGWILLIPTGLAMMDLRNYSPWLLLGIMMLVWVADISAYFAGRRFGKNKLAPNISPGKTWEGVIGALAGVSVYLVVAVYVAVSWELIDYPHLLRFLPNLLIAAWCWVGLAVLGDLFESLIKRQVGAKDSGALLPGHGGLLDRIDALTSTLPLAALAILLQGIP